MLGGAALIAYIGQRYVRVVPLVGFLMTGVLLGPHALGLVRDLEVVEGAAEVGVILLLFTIGIEFSLERLARIKRLILGAGGLQVGITTMLVAAMVVLAGGSWQAGVFTGFLASLSSTVIVLKLLGDRGMAATSMGQASLAILLFQDFAIVLMVLLVPVLSGSTLSGSDVVAALGKAAAIVLLVLLFARRVMPPFLERVARTCEPDIFLLTVIGICFGTAWLTSLAGVSVSLGAFLAGLIVSESRFSHHAFSELLPLRIIFSAVFFVSVGVLLDPGFVVRYPLAVAAVLLGIVALKAMATTLSLRIMGLPLAVASAVGVLLAQVGEFTFVLEQAGRQVGLFPGGIESGSQVFIAATVVLMAGTPLLAKLAWRSEAAVTHRTLDRVAADAVQRIDDAMQPDGHTIITGYGQRARRLAAVLRAAGVAHVIVTLSPDGASHAEREGSVVLIGDYSRRAILDSVGITRARVLVNADDDFAMAERVVSVARMLNDAVSIIVLAADEADAGALRAAGADNVIVVEDRVDRALLDHVLGAAAVDASKAASTEVVAAHVSVSAADGAAGCTHLDQIRPVTPRTPGSCEDCLRIGSHWVHLRMCMTCGHVGCCDSSPNRHATRHYQDTGHPIIRSAEPGENWGWCYADRVELGFD